MASPDKHASLYKLGMPTLKQAFTNHLTATYPDAFPALFTTLLDVILSRHNLIRVAEGLESKDLIVVLKCKENDRITLRRTAFALAWMAMASPFLAAAAPGSPLMHKIWEVAGLVYTDNKYDVKKFWE